MLTPIIEVKLKSLQNYSAANANKNYIEITLENFEDLTEVPLVEGPPNNRSKNGGIFRVHVTGMYSWEQKNGCRNSEKINFTFIHKLSSGETQKKHCGKVN